SEATPSPPLNLSPLRRRLGGSRRLEPELEELRARDRIEAVRRNRAESERAVERARRAHGRNRVETHGLVAPLPRCRHDRLGEASAQAGPARGGADVEALHLADPGPERAQGGAAGRLASHEGKEYGVVVARKLRELTLEILKAEVETERSGVLLDELAEEDDLRVGSGVDDSLAGAHPLGSEPVAR